MLGQPKTKFNSLIEELNKLNERKEELSPIKRSQLKKEANNLLKIDQAEGFTILGIIARMDGDNDNMRKYHENALIYSGNESVYLYNYAVSLGRSGFPVDALEYAEKAFMAAVAPKDKIDSLDLIIDLSDLLGFEDKLFDYAEKWMTLTGKPHEAVDIGLDEEDEEEVEALLKRFDREIESDRSSVIEIGRELLEKVSQLTEATID